MLEIIYDSSDNKLNKLNIMNRKKSDIFKFLLINFMIKILI